MKIREGRMSMSGLALLANPITTAGQTIHDPLAGTLPRGLLRVRRAPVSQSKPDSE